MGYCPQNGFYRIYILTIFYEDWGVEEPLC
jgi:hypothetical protein